MSDHIEVYEKALKRDFCKELVSKFEEDPSRLSQGRSSGGIDKSRKDSLDITITGYADWQSVVHEINNSVMDNLVAYVRKYSHMLYGLVGSQIRDPITGSILKITHKLIEGMPASDIAMLTQKIYKFAPINLQKYEAGKGGYHKWHSEISPSDPNCEVLHRVLFYIYYLNDVDEGGETCFYYQDKSVKPRTGRLVISPAGFTHTHKGNIPYSNDKYILTSWIKYRRFEELIQ